MVVVPEEGVSMVLGIPMEADRKEEKLSLVLKTLMAEVVKQK